MSQKYILGIPVSFEVFESLKSYVGAVKHQHDSDFAINPSWVLGYFFANAESSLRYAFRRSELSESQYFILWRFLENLTLSSFSRFKLYK